MKDTREQVTKAELDLWAKTFLAFALKFVDFEHMDKVTLAGEPAWQVRIDKASDAADYICSIYQMQEDSVHLVPSQEPSWPDEESKLA